MVSRVGSSSFLDGLKADIDLSTIYVIVAVGTNRWDKARMVMRLESRPGLFGLACLTIS